MRFYRQDGLDLDLTDVVALEREMEVAEGTPARLTIHFRGGGAIRVHQDRHPDLPNLWREGRRIHAGAVESAELEDEIDDGLPTVEELGALTAAASAIPPSSCSSSRAWAALATLVVAFATRAQCDDDPPCSEPEPSSP